MLVKSNYAENHAGIIGKGLNIASVEYIEAIFDTVSVTIAT